MVNHLVPLEKQNSFTVFMQTLKVRLELSEKLWLYSNKKYDTKAAKRCYKKFPKIHMKIPVPESLSDKVAGLRP